MRLGGFFPGPRAKAPFSAKVGDSIEDWRANVHFTVVKRGTFRQMALWPRPQRRRPGPMSTLPRQNGAFFRQMALWPRPQRRRPGPTSRNRRVWGTEDHFPPAKPRFFPGNGDVAAAKPPGSPGDASSVVHRHRVWSVPGPSPARGDPGGSQEGAVRELRREPGGNQAAWLLQPVWARGLQRPPTGG